MHYTISKEQIEQALKALESHDDRADDAIAMLQGLLAQPEDDGSDWFYKLKFICRVLEGVSPDKTDMQTALGMARSLRRERWTAEKALQHITAEDVPKQLVRDLWITGELTSLANGAETIVTFVNAFMPSYMGAKK